MVYDVSSNATIGDSLRGCCTQLVGNGSMGTQVPAVTCPAGFQKVADIGQWVPLTNLAPHGNGETLLLLSDGTVLAHTFSGGTLGNGSIFDKLTPDTTGSYVNGTWSSITPMARERLAFSSAILKDGRVYCAGGEYGTDGTQNGWHGEVYNPLTNTWTSATGVSSANVMSDGNCKILENGNILQGIVNTSFPTTTRIFNPATMAYTAGPTTLGGHNESMWLKLPDNTILFVNEGAQSSERYNPATNSWISDANVPVLLYDPNGLECGPGWLLPNGKAFFVGATGKTAIYTPSGTTSPGTWLTGPDVPSGRGMPDAPGAMMINGKILIAVSAIPTSTVEFASPTYFYEYDYLTNSYTQVNAPGGGLSVNQISQNANMLDLPDGTVLYASDAVSTNQYYVYVPSGTPLASGKPAVNNITSLTCTTFMISGIKFNGISEGAAFGDEGENDSNFPVVRLTSATGRVYYARSYNWNSTGVQRGNNPDTTYFSPGVTVPAGTYSLSVIANGIASDTVTFVYNPPNLTSTLTPPGICSNMLFTYHPTSADVNATFTWTRASVAGISNPAITAPQATDPGELLINISATPKSVVYKYIITSGGCSVIQNVTVVVSPIHRLTASSANLIICLGSSTDLIASGGSNYSWNPGGSANNPFTVSPGLTTPYTLSGINSYGCVDTAFVTVTVNQFPTTATAGTDQNLCSTTTSLSGNNPTSGTGLWTLVSGSGIITNPGSFSSGVTGLGAGANVFQWTISNNPCAPSSSTVTIHVDLPVATISVQSGDTLISSPAVSYQWYNATGIMSGQTNRTLVNPAVGYYHVCITDVSGCTACSDSIYFNPLGLTPLSENTSGNIITFPNPTSGNFEIIFFTTNKNSVRIELDDVIGQTVFTDLLQANTGKNKIAIADKKLAKGIYFLVVYLGENKYTKKVIVQ